MGKGVCGVREKSRIGGRRKGVVWGKIELIFAVLVNHKKNKFYDKFKSKNTYSSYYFKTFPK